MNVQMCKCANMQMSIHVKASPDEVSFNKGGILLGADENGNVQICKYANVQM